MPNVDEILRGARESMSATRVFGEPVERDGITVVPAAAVRGGGGGGGDNQENGGVGFGVDASPVGAFVIKDGQVSWRPAVNVNRIMIGWQIVALVALLLAARRRRSKR
jgi:uncharacterized spore protein YtfJ